MLVVKPERGLYYLRNRYCDPSTGQFLSRDPLQNLTRQPYSYAEDNPLNKTDRNGLCPECLIDLGEQIVNFFTEYGPEVAEGGVERVQAVSEWVSDQADTVENFLESGDEWGWAVDAGNQLQYQWDVFPSDVFSPPPQPTYRSPCGGYGPTVMSDPNAPRMYAAPTPPSPQPQPSYAYP